MYSSYLMGNLLQEGETCRKRQVWGRNIKKPGSTTPGQLFILRGIHCAVWGCSLEKLWVMNESPPERDEEPAVTLPQRYYQANYYRASGDFLLKSTETSVFP